MATEVRAKVSLDSSEFESGIGRVGEGTAAAERGFGQLEHVMARVGGANRELIMGFRGIENVLEGVRDGATGAGAALTTALGGAGILVAGAAIIHEFEEIKSKGDEAFKEVGLSSSGWFASLEAGLGILDLTNEKLAKTADVLAFSKKELTDYGRKPDARRDADESLDELAKEREDLAKLKERANKLSGTDLWNTYESFLGHQFNEAPELGQTRQGQARNAIIKEVDRRINDIDAESGKTVDSGKRGIDAEYWAKYNAAADEENAKQDEQDAKHEQKMVEYWDKYNARADQENAEQDQRDDEEAQKRQQKEDEYWAKYNARADQENSLQDQHDHEEEERKKAQLSQEAHEMFGHGDRLSRVGGFLGSHGHGGGVHNYQGLGAMKAAHITAQTAHITVQSAHIVPNSAGSYSY